MRTVVTIVAAMPAAVQKIWSPHDLLYTSEGIFEACPAGKQTRIVVEGFVGDSINVDDVWRYDLVDNKGDMPFPAFIIKSKRPLDIRANMYK